jgi:hypothetical protein
MRDPKSREDGSKDEVASMSLESGSGDMESGN